MLKWQAILGQIVGPYRKNYPLFFLSCPIPFWEILKFSSVLSELFLILSDLSTILSDIFLILSDVFKIAREEK